VVLLGGDIKLQHPDNGQEPIRDDEEIDKDDPKWQSPLGQEITTLDQEILDFYGMAQKISDLKFSIAFGASPSSES
jgi:hypothetical protein